MATNPYVPASTTGNGTQTDFSFTFPYLAQTHVKARLNGVQTAAFTFLSTNVLRFTTPPLAGTAVLITRETPVDVLSAEIQAGGPLPVDGINNNFRQNLYYSQETQYDVGNQTTAGLQAQITAANTTANNALTVANTNTTFTQSGTGAVGRNLSSKLKDAVSVKDFGAVGDGVADDTAAIQAAIDANPNGTVVAVAGETYRCASSIVLVNSTGKNFQGDLDFYNAKVVFSTTGSSASSDATMANGFVVYPTLNATGGDITGLRQSRISNIRIEGPTNGAGFRLANSQNVSFTNVHTKGHRYGIACESTINVSFINCTFEDYHNAGVGLIRSLNASIWYRNPATSWWNDSPVFQSCGFKNGYQTQPMAHILDHGSSSLGLRKVTGCYFYSRWDGEGSAGPMISTQFGIVSRTGQWSVDSSWFENVTYPVYVAGDNTEEIGNLPSVTGAQPSGTYAFTQFPNGFSYSFICENVQFARAFDELTLTGVRNTARLCGNISQLIRNGGVCVKSLTGSPDQKIFDSPAVVLSPVGSYSYTSIANKGYIEDGGKWVSWTPTITAGSGSITTLGTVACSYFKRGKIVQVRGRIEITTNGTAAGVLFVTPPVIGIFPGAGAVSGREKVGGYLFGGQVEGTSITLVKSDGTYPGASGAVLIFSGVYEAA
jgi:hypothetical protein